MALYQNPIKPMLKEGKKVSVAWAQLGSPLAAELLAKAGFDVVMIDAEHSPVDTMDMVHMCQAIRAGGAVPFARAPWNDLVTLKRMLDCGIAGIWVPYVSTKEEAQRAVAACKYPPAGNRGIAASPRACGFGMNADQYMQRSNEEVVVMCAIETPQAIANLDDILTVEGLDGVCIGPTDLATSYGYFAQPNHPDMLPIKLEAEQKILQSGRFLATVAPSFEAAKELYDRGYSYVSFTSDGVSLATLCAAQVKAFDDAFRK